MKLHLIGLIEQPDATLVDAGHSILLFCFIRHKYDASYQLKAFYYVDQIADETAFDLIKYIGTQ